MGRRNKLVLPERGLRQDRVNRAMLAPKDRGETDLACFAVDEKPIPADNAYVIKTVEQTVHDFRTVLEKLRRETRDPGKAAAFLVRAGIAERTKKSKAHPHGVRLAKRFR